MMGTTHWQKTIPMHKQSLISLTTKWLQTTEHPWRIWGSHTGHADKIQACCLLVNCTSILNELLEMRAEDLAEMSVTINQSTVSYSRIIESEHVLPNLTVKWIAFLHEVLVSNLGPQTIYINWGFPWISSVSLGKFTNRLTWNRLSYQLHCYTNHK